MLVVDFKDKNEQNMKINVLAPVVEPPKLPEIEKASKEVQTQPEKEPVIPKKKEKEP